MIGIVDDHMLGFCVRESALPAPSDDADPMEAILDYVTERLSTGAFPSWLSHGGRSEAVDDLYISADVEADGPIPGRYSMLSFGLAVAATFDGTTFRLRDPAAATFYRELAPISSEFVPGALEVSGLDRERLVRDGADPGDAMRQAAAWVREQASGYRAVLVGYPVVFDWMFVHWYFVRFAGGSPFGFSSALDMKTIYQQKARVPLGRAGRTDLPTELLPDRPHTHNALDDAIEQAEIFNRLFEWEGAG